MSQWENWMRGFVKTWFSNLVSGLSNLDSETREKIIEQIDQEPAPTKTLEQFKQAWKNTDLNKAKKEINEALDNIKDCDETFQNYIHKWFTRFMQNVEMLDEDLRKLVLKPCGKGCAGFATKDFKKAWNQSENLKAFVENLDKTITEGEGVYKYENEQLITVTYPRCLCTLVSIKIVDSPVLCNCSSEWLQTNFSTVLDNTVEIERVDTVLSGAPVCKFNVRIS